MSPALSDENFSVSVSCLYSISSASCISQRYCCFTSIHLSYFSSRQILNYFSTRVCVSVCALSKADFCQVLGRLISFVFHTVSSIYPSPVERGGKSLRYCYSGEQNLTRMAQFPQKQLLLLGLRTA